MCVNDIGANQAGIDKLVSELNSQYGDNTAIGVVADVSSSAEVKKMVEESVQKLGPLTVMVANAGIASVTPVLEISDEDMKKMMDVNFTGVWNWFVLSFIKPPWHPPRSSHLSLSTTPHEHSLLLPIYIRVTITTSTQLTHYPLTSATPPPPAK